MKTNGAMTCTDPDMTRARTQVSGGTVLLVTLRTCFYRFRTDKSVIEDGQREEYSEWEIWCHLQARTQTANPAGVVSTPPKSLKWQTSANCRHNWRLNILAPAEGTRDPGSRIRDLGRNRSFWGFSALRFRVFSVDCCERASLSFVVLVLARACACVDGE